MSRSAAIFIQAIFATIYFGVTAFVCELRGHRWGKTVGFRHIRERVCERCHKVDHWEVEPKAQ